jgi:hypothetical protein
MLLCIGEWCYVLYVFFQQCTFFSVKENDYLIRNLMNNYVLYNINYYWWSIVLPLMFLTVLFIGITKLDFMLKSVVIMLRAKFLRSVIDIMWHEWWNHNSTGEIILPFYFLTATYGIWLYFNMVIKMGCLVYFHDC